VLEAEHDSHSAHGHGVHESPAIMTLPLIALAILSVIGGWVGIPAAMGGHNEIEHFLEPVFASGALPAAATTAGSNGLAISLAATSVLAALIGFGIAYLFYFKQPGRAARFVFQFPAFYRVLDNKFYIDEIYHAAIVTPLLMFTRLILGGLIDKGVVNGSGALAGATTRGLGALTRRIQSGNIRSYAGWLALGAAAVLIVMIFGRGVFPH
jgi:NADH-quinone oxidoreductase subunit L